MNSRLSSRKASNYFVPSKDWRKLAHSKGIALKSHMDSQHGGYFVVTCPACMELKRKLTEIQEGGITETNGTL